MNSKMPFQSSAATPLQKAFFSPGRPDGGVEYDAITVIDETVKKGSDGHTFIVYCNRGELRAALLDAEQRGDPRIVPSDSAFVDSGRVRKSVLEAIYPGHDWAGTDESTDGRPGWRGRGPIGPDGQPMVKSRSTDMVREAYKSYTRSPGADLKAAAAELDALVERVRRG
jgi:hypothetical protein